MVKPKVVVAGHICLDITPVFPLNAGASGAGLKDMLVPGKLTRVAGVDIHSGGVVANTGLAMALFGADVSLMGKIGKDAFGSMIMDLLNERGQGKSMIVTEGASTAYTIVIAAPGCDRLFLHDPGANDDFHFLDLDFDLIRSSRLFHFGYPTLMTSMFADGGRELIDMFKAIDEANVMTSLDLTVVDEQSAAAKADWKGILKHTLPYVDFFMPSYEELSFMLDRNALERLRSRAEGADITACLSIEEDVAPLAGQAIALGAKVVLIKCGERGFYYRTAGSEAMSTLVRKYDGNRPSQDSPLSDWADLAGFEKGYVSEKVLSGTGAGDTTIAAFLIAMLEGYPFDRCIQLAAATGASCVEAYDALGGLRSFSELEKKIDAGWRKCT